MFGGLGRFLGRTSQRFDTALRLADLHVRRTDGGLLRKINPRYSPGVVALPALLAWGLVAGSPETSPRFWMGLAAGVVVGLISLALLRLTRNRPGVVADFSLQGAVILALCGWMWGTLGDRWNLSHLYMHDLVPLTVTTTAALIVGMFFLLLTGPPKNFDTRVRLSRTELFEPRETPQRATWLGAIAGVGAIFSSGLLHLLWPPAVAALLSKPTPVPLMQSFADLINDNVRTLPTITWVHLLAGTAFVATLFVLVLTSLNPRLDAMWSLLAGAFFRGGALPVSLIIIVLGIGRILEVSYVTTVFDSDERWVFARWLLSLYFLAWWYDYWHKRLLAQRLLHWIRPVNPRAEASTVYHIKEEFRLATVEGDHRKFQVHGSGRFLAIRELAGETTLFQLHTMTSAFDKLSGSGGTPEDARFAREWRAKIVGFQVGMGILAVAFAGIPAFFILHKGPQAAEATVERTGNSLELSTLFWAGDCSDKDPIIALAASGGGTRAALYTAAMLEALRGANQLDRVKVVSGVSGGGAALAYFASRRKELLASEAGGPAWNDFFSAMQQPYIVEVLHRATEWHMFKEGRLGSALADSFHKNWGSGGRETMGEVDDVGLLLNSTIDGEFDAADVASGSGSLEALESQHLDRRRSDLAGGRFVMTNLKLPSGFGARIDQPRGRFEAPIIVDAPDLKLSEAAALNANFPPVFSNSAVDNNVTRTRYWVTDGGAADNRGLESLLWAIDSAVQARPATCGHVPDILVIELDAGGFSNAYSQDRGAGAALAGGGEYASALSGEIRGVLDRTYRDPNHPDRDKVQLFYIEMPLPMRMTWGTHWMLQDTIALRPADRKARPQTVSGVDAIGLLRALHNPPSPTLAAASWYGTVRGWLTADCWHTDEWKWFTDAFAGKRNPTQTACPPQPPPGKL